MQADTESKSSAVRECPVPYVKLAEADNAPAELPADILDRIFRLARPKRQWDTSAWITIFPKVMYTLADRVLYEEVYFSSPEGLKRFRKSLDAPEAQYRGPAVKTLFFDLDDKTKRNACKEDLEAVLPRLTTLRVLRVSFNSLDRDALRFWANLAEHISPSLRVLRMSDVASVSLTLQPLCP